LYRDHLVDWWTICCGRGCADHLLENDRLLAWTVRLALKVKIFGPTPSRRQKYSFIFSLTEITISHLIMDPFSAATGAFSVVSLAIQFADGINKL
jgi:hypothetical protein